MIEQIDIPQDKRSGLPLVDQRHQALNVFLRQRPVVSMVRVSGGECSQGTPHQITAVLVNIATNYQSLQIVENSYPVFGQQPNRYSSYQLLKMRRSKILPTKREFDEAMSKLIPLTPQHRCVSKWAPVLAITWRGWGCNYQA